jgi:hypothetical protein
MSIFRAPMGTEEERNSGKIWPGTWEDATPYNTRYQVIKGGNWHYHTGADLNWNRPRWDADAHAPIYAMGDGKVTYSDLYSEKVWGQLIIINHGMVDGKPLFSRYAHVESRIVVKDQLVHTGDHIANVGDGNGIFKNNHHLHFDISTTDILDGPKRDPRGPGYWPGSDQKGVEHHFVNPMDWLRQHQGDVITENVFLESVLTNDDVLDTTPPSASATVWYVIAPAGSIVRKDHGMAAEQVVELSRGSKLFIEAKDGGDQDGFNWGHISGGKYNGCWVAICKEDRSETYVSTNPPHD